MSRSGPSRAIALAMLSLLGALGAGVPAAAGGDAPDGVRLIPISGPGHHVRLAPDGRSAAVFLDSDYLNPREVQALRLPISTYDIVTGERTGLLVGHGDYADDATFTADGSRLVSYHLNGQVAVWDLAHPGEPPRVEFETTLTGTNQWIEWLGATPLVVTTNGGPLSHLIVWDASTGAPVRILGLTFATSNEVEALMEDQAAYGNTIFASLSASPDGTHAAVSTAADEVAIWDLGTGERTIVRPRTEGMPTLRIRQVTYSRDGATLAWSDRDPAAPAVHIRDLASGDETVVPSATNPFALSPDGRRVAWVQRSDDDVATVRIVDLARPDAAAVLAVVDGPRWTKGARGSLDFTPDGSTLVLAGFSAEDEDNAFAVIDVSADALP